MLTFFLVNICEIMQGSKLKKKFKSPFGDYIIEKRSPNAKMQSPDNTRNIKIMWK